MSALSADQSFRARKNLSTIFTGLSNVGQVTVAKALQVSEGQVSKMKTDDLPTIADVLAVCGLKVVPESFRCYEPRVIDALLVLAKDKLNRMRGPEELEWEQE